MATQTAAVTDTIKLRSAVSLIKGYRLAIAEHLILRGSLSPKLFRVLKALDVMKLHAELTEAGVFHVTAADRLRFRAALRYTTTARLLNHLGLRDKLTAAQVVSLRESLSLSHRLATSAIYAGVAAEHLEFFDDVSLLLGSYLHDELHYTGELSRLYRTIAALDDELALTATLKPLLRVVVQFDDELELTEAMAIDAIYHGILRDGIDFVMDVMEPVGDVTTWAMNVRTGALTQYLDYAFSSMARSTKGTYLGAADDGLYELIGAGDDDRPIVADLISGLTDMSGTFFTSFKAAYLGLRGQGQFYLKLTTGNGKSYVYGVRAKSLENARVNMGKGLRARYFTWELTSTGQDFDLTDIVFLPISSSRRSD